MEALVEFSVQIKIVVCSRSRFRGIDRMIGRDEARHPCRDRCIEKHRLRLDDNVIVRITPR